MRKHRQPTPSKIVHVRSGVVPSETIGSNTQTDRRPAMANQIANDIIKAISDTLVSDLETEKKVAVIQALLTALTALFT
jgi:hypothetical protein